MAKKPGKLFIVSGPSAVGKTTIVAHALQRLMKKYDIKRLVTYTSRPPRRGETGEAYNFISGDEFNKKIEQGFFLETTEYAGHRYGSPKPSKQDMELGKSFVLVMDIAGAKAVSKMFDNTVLLWIQPPDMTTLGDRMKKRGNESQKELENRLAKAKHEMEEAHKHRLFQYTLVNDLFEDALDEFILVVSQELGD